MSLPLRGVKIVSVEQYGAGPFGTQHLADLGAEVIKIERPGEGDFARGYDKAIKGESAYFAWLNRGKKSVVLDIRAEPGRTQLAQLVDSCDVFVHNLTPGAIERIGLGYDEVHGRSPRTIWVGLSGYGPDGPHRDRKAYDMLIQAESGIVSLTGSADEPAKVGVSIADIGSGMYAYSSILAALYAREKSGEGMRIDISMLECMTEWMMPPLYTFLGEGRVSARAGLRHNMIVPYGAYACADGRVLFAIQSDGEFRRFCDGVLQQPGVADDTAYSTNGARLLHRDALEALIDQVFSTLPLATVQERLERSGIANAAVNDVPQVANHPQLAARKRWRTVQVPGGEIPALLPPHNLGGVEPVMGAVPALGEHTEEILNRLPRI